MNIFKAIREARKQAKEFEYRIKELERMVVKPEEEITLHNRLLLPSWLNIKPTLHGRIDCLEREIKAQSTINHLLLDHLELKLSTRKAQPEKLVLKKKK